MTVETHTSARSKRPVNVRARVCVWAAFGCVLVLGAASAVGAQERDDRLRLDLKLGVESDSNAQRVEGPDARGDQLVRYFLKLESDHSIGATQGLSLKLRSGGKYYKAIQEENTLLSQVDARYALYPLGRALEGAAGRRWFVYANGSVKDRTEDASRRDYLRGYGSVGMGVALKPVVLSAGAGFVFFAFKPNPDLSSQGPTWDVQASVRLSDAWVTQAAVSWQQRSYRSAPLLLDAGAVIPADPGVEREDIAWAFSGGVTYRGTLIVGLQGAVQDTASNSYGQSLRRYGGALTVTAPLFWELLVSGRAALQRTAYGDELFIDETLTVDEDNRNTYVVSIERELTDVVRVEGRYALYTQEFGLESADYTRQLVFVGLGAAY